MANEPLDPEHRGNEYDDQWSQQLRAAKSRETDGDRWTRQLRAGMPPMPEKRATPASELAQQENAGGKPKQDQAGGDESEKLNNGYTGGGNNKGKQRGIAGKLKLGSALKKKALTVAAIAGISVSLAGFTGFFGFMNNFKLDFFLSNVEKNGFMRYQVDLDGRTTKWIQAYMMLRMGEIEDPELQPQDRENLLFRANQVDTGNPVYDWFRTLRTPLRTERAVYSFEQDVFESEGIKFTSVAQRQPDGSVRFRPGKITVNGADVTFNLTDAELEAVDNGDINLLNGRLQEFLDVEVFANDKEGRKMIKKAVNERVKPWQVIKKRQLRKDIQNMTGIRDWRFFETTRDRFNERTISVRNKFIVKTLPESTKSGKFIQCMFGITSCRASSDVAHPENRSNVASGEGQRQGETYVNEDGETVNADNGQATGSVEEGLQDTVGDGDLGAEGFQKKFIAQIINKFSGVLSFASIMDTLSRIDKGMRDGSLSKMVIAARGAQTAAIFSTLMIARDQMKTGELTSPEVQEFMTSTGNDLGRNEVWDVISSGNSSGTVSAAAEENVGKVEYCSEEHQANLTAAEFHHLCDDQKIGGKNNAQVIEKGWVNGPGKVLGAPLAAYRETVGRFLGPILDLAGDAASAILTPVIKPILAATGLDSKIEDFSGWAFAKSSEALGAGPMIDTETPSGVIGNLAGVGSAYTAESAARYQGAAATTTLTKADAINRTIAYNTETNEQRGFTERYLALDSPDSFAATQLYAASMNTSITSPMKAIGSVFSSIAHIPQSLMTSPASAQGVSPYLLSDLAAVDTFDFPNTCINGRVLNMTPQSATNADDLGIIPADELSWELLGNKEAFFDRLYRDNPDESKALSVYNCGLLDNTVRSGLGAKYGWNKDNAIASKPSAEEPSSDDSTDGPSELVSGESKELAKQIINSPKITIASKYKGQVEGIASGNGSCHVNPTILQLLVTISKSHSIYISSLNRLCTNTLTASGSASYHYRERGGHAVDIAGVDGNSSTGTTEKDLQLLKKVLPLLPEGSGVGQSNCRAASGKSLSMPAGVTQFSDACNHIHIQVPVQ